MSETIINNIKITDNNGLSSFTPIETEKEILQPAVQSEGFFGKILDFFRRHDVKPYIKNRNLSDPFDRRDEDMFDDGSGSKHAAKIGIKISF